MSYLVENPEDRFSRDGAQINPYLFQSAIHKNITIKRILLKNYSRLLFTDFSLNHMKKGSPYTGTGSAT